MEEIKTILLGMQKSQDEMKEEIKGMQKSQDEMKEEIKGMQKSQDEMKEEIKGIKKTQNEMKEELLEKVHEVNQRLAVFQEEITSKVNILLDADAARQELLEVHDSEILEIREEQFKHSVRINNLEKKVVGA